MTTELRSVHGAGTSAEVWARQLRRARPWWRRLADWLGMLPDTRTGAAQRAGAVGERKTAAIINPLTHAGWHIRHDLAIPGSRANVDHLLIPPHGQYTIVLDSKLWSRKRGTVAVRHGRLTHGVEDRSSSERAVLKEAGAVQERLRIQAVPLIVVHSAPVAPGLSAQGVPVISADQLLPLLQAHARRGRPDPARVKRLAATAARLLPDYS